MTLAELSFQSGPQEIWAHWISQVNVSEFFLSKINKIGAIHNKDKDTCVVFLET